MINNVDSPKHYTRGKYETIDVIQSTLGDEKFKGYVQGNIIKYISRYQYKNGVEDLEKARWYLNKLIEHEKGSNDS